MTSPTCSSPRGVRPGRRTDGIGAGGAGHPAPSATSALIAAYVFDGTIIGPAPFPGRCHDPRREMRRRSRLGTPIATVSPMTTKRCQPEFGRPLPPSSAGVPANWLVASLERVGLDLAEMPEAPAGGKRHNNLPEHVRPWRDIWSAGQGIDVIDDIPTVEQLVRRLREQYVAACAAPSMAEAARRAI